MKNPVTIYLADDHQIIIDGLKLLIGSEETIKITGYANDGTTAYNDIIAKKPDIAILDIRMPGKDGMELVQELKRLVETKFIILSMHNSKRYIKDAFNNGASGYLLKSFGKHELMTCIGNIMKGEKYFPAMPAEPADARSLFTPRETEILRLVIDEYTTAEIAEKLYLSPLTVETHRKNIGRKTNTSTVLGLLKFMLENKIEV